MMRVNEDLAARVGDLPWVIFHIRGRSIHSLSRGMGLTRISGERSMTWLGSVLCSKTHFHISIASDAPNCTHRISKTLRG